jgi:hypothetical protein
MMHLTCPPTRQVYIHKVPNKSHKKGLSTWDAYYGPPVEGEPLSLCHKERGLRKLFNPTGVTVTEFIEFVEQLMSTGKANTFYFNTLSYVDDP